MPFVIPVLALAVFAQGTSEFMLAGLLLDISADLGVSPATAGLLTSAFALGMVVGAPAMALFAVRWHPRRTLLVLLAVFLAAHVCAALAPTFELLLLTRLVAAVSNAGFLAVALGAVRAIVPAALTTRAVSVLLAGTTLATIVGVPAGAALASVLGWRSTFWAVAALCVPALVAIARDRTLVAPGGGASFTLRREVAELHRRPVLGGILLGVLVNAATFGVFTYLGVVAEAAGIVPALVPVLLAAFGVGAFAGVSATGRWAAPRERRWIVTGLWLLGGAWAGFALVAGGPVGVLVLTPVCGALSFAVGSAVIGRIVREAAGAPVLGGAFATVALNLGATLGPAVAGAAQDRAGAPAVLLAAALAVGVAALVSSWALAGRRGAREG